MGGGGGGLGMMEAGREKTGRATKRDYNHAHTHLHRDLCDLDNTHGQDSDNFWCILVPDLMAAEGK